MMMSPRSAFLTILLVALGVTTHGADIVPAAERVAHPMVTRDGGRKLQQALEDCIWEPQRDEAPGCDNDAGYYKYCCEHEDDARYCNRCFLCICRTDSWLHYPACCKTKP